MLIPYTKHNKSLFGFCDITLANRNSPEKEKKYIWMLVKENLQNTSQIRNNNSLNENNHSCICDVSSDVSY